MIAIDGPAASGKSTLAQRLADELGYLYFDTGVMYRAVTLEALRRGISIDDELKVTEIAERISIDVRPPSIDDGRMFDVWVEGKDITWDLRSVDVDKWVSKVSMYTNVRKAMTLRQREIGLRGRVVMVGRDIGTVVLPEADFKIYLDAHVTERARRRYLESKPCPEYESLEEVLQSMDKRDYMDSTRDLAPLKASPDAIVIDTTDLDIDQVFQYVKDLVIKYNSNR